MLQHHRHHATRTIPAHHAAPRSDAIEWEELPSFADSLTQRLVIRGSRPLAQRVEAATAPAWIETMAAELEVIEPSEPFRETLEGLDSREVFEPEVFRLFFGS